MEHFDCQSKGYSGNNNFLLIKPIPLSLTCGQNVERAAKDSNFHNILLCLIDEGNEDVKKNVIQFHH